MHNKAVSFRRFWNIITKIIEKLKDAYANFGYLVVENFM